MESLLSELTPVFLYGTLMAPELLSWLLTGNKTETEMIIRRRKKVILHGYKRCTIRFVDYPALVKTDNPEDTVDGFLFYPRDINDMRKLDNFEGEPYRREKVVVSVDDKLVDVYAYIWHGECERLGDRQWSFEEFLEDSLEEWLELWEGMEFI
jgi:gamma-glutamylcyclotransferase (GGCT)/AIG2-like uncharacterized protein YtfP